MHKQMFVNLAVDDLPRSRKFFEAMGFSFNPQFSNEQGGCLVLGENLFAMLLTKDFFTSFGSKPLSDPSKTTEVMIALSCESRAEVEALVAKAVAAGGKAPRAPQDQGFMYGHGFDDPDGHIWELFYMDMSAAPAAP